MPRIEDTKKEKKLKQIKKKKKKLETKIKKTKPKKIEKKVPTIKVKKKKIRFGRVCIALVLLIFLCFSISQLVSFPIKNIYVKGNTIYKEQKIIELAKLDTYPSYFSFTRRDIENRLKKDIYILSCKVYKKNISEVIIEIKENKPLLFNETENVTILQDGSKVSDTFIVPTLLNYVPDTIYSKFLSKLSLIDNDIYIRISEIKYDPNEVDEERFIFYMDDKNKVYVTLRTMEKMNEYVSITKEVMTKYEDKKGTLFLDSGEYFKVEED